MLDEFTPISRNNALIHLTDKPFVVINEMLYGLLGQRLRITAPVGGGAPPEVVLGTPVPLHRCAPGRVLSGETASGAAPIHDERGTLIAAIAITPASTADEPAVTHAAHTITALIRDGVL